MPLAVGDSPRLWPTEKRSAPAPVVGIRLESGVESRLGKVAFAGIALGVVGCVLAISLYRGGAIATRAFYSPIVQSNIALNSHDDYAAIVRKLGVPARERWHDDYGQREYELLAYPQRGVYVILMGLDRADMRYIGSLDRRWQPVHAVALPGYGDTFGLLKRLPRF
jgi:hypothetical protein